jgi:hypothetical protein
MMRIACASLLALTIACSTVLLAQSGPRRDGRWEVTVEMQMPNMPPGMMPPTKQIQCITKEEAADPQKALPGAPQRAGGPPPDCKMTDQKQVGNKFTWAMACTGAMAMQGTGEMTYSGDSYTGQMVMNGAMRGQPMGMTMKYSGKRLGDCVK